MTWIVVDVEADGPAPGLYSMVTFGAVVVDRALDRTFQGLAAPISDAWIPEALAVGAISRAAHLTFPDPGLTMQAFAVWVDAMNRGNTRNPVFVSDNPAFDWQWINYYFHRYVGRNPFGHSARRIGDLFAGMKGDARAAWKHLRKTTHDHNPVNDAKGNAEALLAMVDMGLKIPGVE